MRLLLDTHLLIWAAESVDKLPLTARTLMEDPNNSLLFSVASIWEVAIKKGRQRTDFTLEPGSLRRGLIDNGYHELNITAEHTIAVAALPNIHQDPFDRLLIAQSTLEDIMLLTHDKIVARYPGPIRKV